jgi:S1-C subfamily serine protease
MAHAATDDRIAASAAPKAAHPRLRDRLIPRTVLGLVALILALSVGAAFSGVVLYSYYEFRLNKTETKVDKFIADFGKNVQQANDGIKAQQNRAEAEIQDQLAPLKKIQAEGSTLSNLVKKASPSMFFVHSLDEAGNPSVGSGFVVASDQDQSLILTSYTTVRASTKKPGPDVFIRQGNGQDQKVTVWTWDEANDLALIIIQKGSMPKLNMGSKDNPPTVGERVFAASGLGGGGAAMSQGFVGDVSSAGIQHDAAIGPGFQGGPLLDSDGNVLAVASRTYAPLGFGTDSVWFGVPIRNACSKVLKCPSDNSAGAGAKR